MTATFVTPLQGAESRPVASRSNPSGCLSTRLFDSCRKSRHPRRGRTRHCVRDRRELNKGDLTFLQQIASPAQGEESNLLVHTEAWFPNQPFGSPRDLHRIAPLSSSRTMIRAEGRCAVCL